MIKGKSSRILRKEFPHGVEIISGHQVATTAQLVMAGMWSKGTFRHITLTNIGENNPEIAIYRPWTICPGYTVTEDDRRSHALKIREEAKTISKI